MQGVHVFDPHAKTVIDLESFIKEDHVLRKIDGLLDLAFVRKLTARCCADGLGRPSIDPEVFFRMEFVAYYYGITSDRRHADSGRCVTEFHGAQRSPTGPARGRGTAGSRNDGFPDEA